MCKSRRSAAALAPQQSASRRSSAAAITNTSSSSSASGPPRTTTSSTSTHSSRSSLAAARASLPDPPLLYPFQELAAATNSFLSKRASASGSDSSYSYWRCSLRGRDAALFQLRARPGLDSAQASAALGALARYHHASLARLLGACLAGSHVYLAYEVPAGAATLAACLRGSPGYSVLGTWLSRVQVAVDVAQGLDYVHNQVGAVHGRVSASTVVVSEAGLRARLTHLGASEFEMEAAGAEASREGDVYAFGVVLLEVVSGEEAERYRMEKRELRRETVVERAEEAAGRGRVRRWVDRRLGDSFPVEAAERVVEVGLRCVGEGEEERPGMGWVAGKLSKAYVEARAWQQQIAGAGAASSLSLGPR